jgi:hypothetical protein
MYPMKVNDQTTDTPLYKRIGGYDVIAAIMDDLFVLMREDSRLVGLERDGASIHADELSN